MESVEPTNLLLLGRYVGLWRSGSLGTFLGCALAIRGFWFRGFRFSGFGLYIDGFRLGFGGGFFLDGFRRFGFRFSDLLGRGFRFDGLYFGFDSFDFVFVSGSWLFLLVLLGRAPVCSLHLGG